jgi:hypothetical protein
VLFVVVVAGSSVVVSVVVAFTPVVLVPFAVLGDAAMIESPSGTGAAT